MAIRLFAHILKGSTATAADAASPSLAIRPLDFGRWVLDELVGRRSDPIAWSFQQPSAPRAPPARSETSAGDSTWADTQPWWHE